MALPALLMALLILPADGRVRCAEAEGTAAAENPAVEEEAHMGDLNAAASRAGAARLQIRYV